MTDEELLLAASKARGAAHRAPFSMFATENQGGKPTGHHFLEDHTDAWARTSRDFGTLMDEVHRRGLAMPACDCPSGSHDEGRK